MIQRGSHNCLIDLVLVVDEDESNLESNVLIELMDCVKDLTIFEIRFVFCSSCVPKAKKANNIFASRTEQRFGALVNSRRLVPKLDKKLSMTDYFIHS
jgi:hypothetical protein